MRAIKILLIGLLAVSVSAPVFSQDGAERSAEMNKQFREGQKRLWGDKDSADKPAPVPTQKKESPPNTL